MNPCVVLVLFALFNSNPDSVIRGVYINPYRANDKEYLEEIFAKADSGLLNTIVVDFKGDYGYLTYASAETLAQKIDAVKRYIDVDYLIKHAADHNLKVIARIVCFRDEYLASYKKYGIRNDSGHVWLDKKGLAWTNPYKQKVRDYLLEVTKEVVQLGFTSIAFDYIRFPTDGDVERIRLTDVKGSRVAAILKFLKRVQKEIGDEVELGVCVFGFTTWYSLKATGQDIAKMGEYIDVLYPMLYPSHFGWSFKREENEYWRNYWIYFDSVKEAMKKLPSAVKIIPFVQGFALGAESFDGEYIFSQISGARSAGADGFVIWNARGDYSISWPALSWARSSILNQSALMSLNSRMKEEGRRYRGRTLQQLLTQEKIRRRNQTIRQTHSLIDSLPLLRNPRFSPGPRFQ